MLNTDIEFEYIDSFGNLHECYILAKFSKNSKNYIIYEAKGSNKLYSSLYEIVGNNIKLVPIEDNVDYDIVDEYLENL